jgi:putative Mg2+ transporter-C (MgtC) family protein
VREVTLKLLQLEISFNGRSPINEETSEATYRFYVICQGSVQVEMREKLTAALKAIKYPVRDIKQHRFGASDTEIQSILHATSVDADEPDKVAAEIESRNGVLQVFWNSSTDE